MPREHLPVLLDEVLDALAICAGGIYLDATFGRGGHSQEILNRLDVDGRLLVIDRDPEAIEIARERYADDARVTIEQGVFADVAAIAEKHGVSGVLDGALFDLGVSSPQLDDPQRGFSFTKEGPLDMRMGPDKGLSAAEWLAGIDVNELMGVLSRFGEERRARDIARAIVKARDVAPIRTTTQLAEIVTSVIPPRFGTIHPATRTFQAIRIALNEELSQLSEALAAIVGVLRVGARLAVISFHSLEDRIVKRFIRERSQVAEPYRGLPDIPVAFQPVLRPIGKLVKASRREIDSNPRARSARLRIAEKIR